MKFTRKKENSSSSFSKEFRHGLAETSKYLLSHHTPEDYGKCFLVFGRRVCSRCSGIYLGIAFGAIIYFFGIASPYYYALVLFFPSAMLLDWFFTRKGTIKSSNRARAGTGFLCGVAYSLGLILFFSFYPNIQVFLIGLLYGLLALAGLTYSNRIS